MSLVEVRNARPFGDSYFKSMLMRYSASGVVPGEHVDEFIAIALNSSPSHSIHRHGRHLIDGRGPIDRFARRRSAGARHA
jgi:hypothetical protein